jgi:hypothetical protein
VASPVPSPDRRLFDDGRNQNAACASFELDLVESIRRTVPVCDHARPWLSGGSGSRRNPVRGESERGASRVVGDQACVSAWPALRQLRPVEKECDDEARPDAPDEVGDLVEARKVLANERGDRCTVAQIDHVERSFPDIDRLPPEPCRVERAAEVVLPDLAIVEAPAMVLVLFVAVPPRSLADTEVEVVATEARGARGLSHAADQDADVAAGERPFQPRDLLGNDRGLRKEDSIDRPCLRGRRL